MPFWVCVDCSIASAHPVFQEESEFLNHRWKAHGEAVPEKGSEWKQTPREAIANVAIPEQQGVSAELYEILSRGLPA